MHYFILNRGCRSEWVSLWARTGSVVYCGDEEHQNSACHGGFICYSIYDVDAYAWFLWTSLVEITVDE